MRKYEQVTAVALVLMAALAMNDSLKRAGWTSSGPDAGFYPFWSAAAMAAAAVAVLVTSFRVSTTGGIFESPEGARAFVRLLTPLVIAAGLISWLGFYVVSGAYMALFARWIGRYHWGYVLLLGLVVPLALYLTFERGFKVPLPKSMFYETGIAPF